MVIEQEIHILDPEPERFERCSIVYKTFSIYGMRSIILNSAYLHACVRVLDLFRPI
jgi:hypothetical protein